MKNFFKWLLRLFLLLTTVYTVVAALLLHGVNAYHTDTEIGKVLAIGGQYTFAAAVILWGVTLFILRRRAVLRKKAAAAGAAQMAAQTAAGTTSLPLDAKTPPIAPRGPVKAAAPAVQQEPAVEKTPVLDSAQEPTPVLPGQESSAGRTAVLQPTPVLPQMDTPAERTELLEPAEAQHEDQKEQVPLVGKQPHHQGCHPDRIQYQGDSKNWVCPQIPFPCSLVHRLHRFGLPMKFPASEHLHRFIDDLQENENVEYVFHVQ